MQEDTKKAPADYGRGFTDGLGPSATLVQRLRDFYTADETNYHIQHPICDEAADEIERLRTALREVLEFQSDPKAPTIHDFGRWRRVVDGFRG